MPARTPTLQQARSHYERQRTLALLVLEALRKLFASNPRPDVAQIAAIGARYQLAASTVATTTIAHWADRRPVTDARAFMGVSSYGFPLTEPIIATIDRVDPAPPAALPPPWWDDPKPFMQELEQLLVSEVQDAGRTASQVEFVAEPGWQGYVRLLNPPSCDRCAVLAGRVYRDRAAFQRHPLCDCVMVPVGSVEAAKAEGLIADPLEAFDKGLVRGLSRADAQAVRDGADITEVVNAKRAGLRAPAGVTNAVTTDVFGHRVKATLHGTTRRAQWRRANPTRLVRLRPESIYGIAKDEADAVRLLRLYGYIK